MGYFIHSPSHEIRHSNVGASDMSRIWHSVEPVSVEASVVSPGDGRDGGEGAFLIVLWGYIFIPIS